jgi:hypothetical protein
MMPAFGQDGRGLHARRPAAGDEYVLRFVSLPAGAVDELASGFGVLDAGDRITLVEMADAGLIASDAGADVVATPGHRLRRHIWIADHGAGHAASIGLAIGDHRFGDLRLVDAAGDQDRIVDEGFDRRGEGSGIGIGIGHGRHDVDGALQGRRRARRDTQIIQAAQRLADAQHFGGLQCVIVALVAGNAGADDEIRT